MELKEKYKALCEVFGVGGDVTFSEGVRRSLGNSAIYEDYLKVCPDLEDDELRGCWQFWHADREDKKQDYTNPGLAKAAAALIGPLPGETVYDCCAGSGALSVAVLNEQPQVSLVCEELDGEVLPLLLFNLSVRNADAIVSHANVLTGERFKTWILTPGKRFSAVQEALMLFDGEKQIDKAISNPPFNLRSDGKLLNFEFVNIGRRKGAKLSATILPNGVMSSTAEKEMRKQLLAEKALRCTVALPSGFFDATNVNTCIVVCSQGCEKATLINAESITETFVREQKGEASSEENTRNAARTYYKKMRTITKAQRDALVIMANGAVTDISMVIPYEDILANDRCSFDMRQYIPVTLDREYVQHRDYNQIIKEINQIKTMLNSLKVTINKVWAEQLGYDKIYELMVSGKEVTRTMNEYNAMLGITEKIAEDDYVSISASKVLKIEQNNKEFISPVIDTFFALLMQHIKTMNNMENKLLAELRDSLLPALMCGDLAFKQPTKEA